MEQALEIIDAILYLPILLLLKTIQCIRLNLQIVIGKYLMIQPELGLRDLYLVQYQDNNLSKSKKITPNQVLKSFYKHHVRYYS